MSLTCRNISQTYFFVTNILKLSPSLSHHHKDVTYITVTSKRVSKTSMTQQLELSIYDFLYFESVTWQVFELLRWVRKIYVYLAIVDSASLPAVDGISHSASMVNTRVVRQKDIDWSTSPSPQATPRYCKRHTWWVVGGVPRVRLVRIPSLNWTLEHHVGLGGG